MFLLSHVLVKNIEQAAAFAALFFFFSLIRFRGDESYVGLNRGRYSK